MVSLVLKPETLEEAVAALVQHGDGAKVVAGGTAVVLMLQNRLIAPEVLISLARVSGLDDIGTTEDGSVKLGALITLADAEHSPLVRERLPALSDTYHQVANVRIRNAATVGGNVTEADYASDPPSVLVALRARACVIGPNRRREIPLSELFTGFFETSLAADELLTDIVIPPLAPTARATYLKFTTRSSEDRPCVGVCAIVDQNANGLCTDLRVVVGAVDETPREVPSAERIGLGQQMTGELISEIAERYAVEIDPLSDLRGSSWYRKEMIRVFVRRALQQVTAV